MLQHLLILADVSQWSPINVQQWLVHVELNSEQTALDIYKNTVQQHKINGKMLLILGLSEANLKEVDIVDECHCKILKEAIHDLRTMRGRCANFNSNTTIVFNPRKVNIAKKNTPHSARGQNKSTCWR